MSRLQGNENRLPVLEAWSSSKQEHLVSRRKRRGCSCACLKRSLHFRLWQLILFLLIEAGIILAIAILLAVYAPWNKNLQNSADARTTETTVAPEEIPTTVPRGPGDKKVLKCGVAIIGGGTAGLLLAYTLLESKNETNVCVFEKGNRLGGKIFDHRFPEAPNVTVGLGEWHIYAANDDERGLTNHLSVAYNSWTAHVHRVEARGVHADSFDVLKSKAFPSLLDRPPLNTTVKETAQFLLRRNTSDFSTAGAFLSSYLTPEGAKLVEEAYGFNGGYEQVINPESFKTYLGEMIQLVQLREYDSRPTRGMSEIIEKLSLKVRRFNGTIYLREAVTSISKEGGKFVLQTTNFTVQANKTVLTAGPAALKKMTGDVIASINNHEIFKSIVSVPAFRGAAVYPSAWWNDFVAAQMNNSLEPLQKFVSSSNCLGITMPYKATGPNGTAVLHTVANNGGCSDMWGNILKISKEAVDREMKRALEYKFQRNIPQEPLDTVYKYWEEGFWYFQKPGAKFSLNVIRQWAKRPLAGNDVFLVGKAFYNFGGWLQDTIYSVNEALKEGWNSTFSWLSF